MTPEQWQKAEALFQEALARTASERLAFLQEVCGEDAELRAEVESLLASHEQAEDFLTEPALAQAEAVDATEADESLVGRRIGAYQVLQEIGQGGMGDVYLAARADDVYRKQVALKVIKRGMDTRAIVHRFRNERQILANLDHPNMAKLLDGGTTEDGLSYFVMDYIHGLPIDQYCDQHQLSTDLRLELFRTVCSAVQYAHQNFVVHRDLKPSNILVTRDGTVKLLDFGIAKLLTPELAGLSLVPSMAVQAMTPEYASPQQVRGEAITTASDVYALGVLLYELLTGHRPYPFARHTPQEIERVVCETVPSKPSTVIRQTVEVSSGEGTAVETLSPDSVSWTREGTVERLRRRLRGDLDTIVLKTLRKEPERRYASAEHLAADLERHLQGRPVLARPDTAAYRAGKFIRRNKAGVAAAALLVLTLLGGVIASQWQARRAERQERISRRLLYAADMNLAFKAWENADVVQAIERLRAHRPQRGQPDLRTFAWYYLWKLCHREALSLAHDEQVTALAFSPDGKFLAVAIGEQTATVKIWDVIRRQEVATLAGHTNLILGVVFSPDGRLLATGSTDETLKLWDAATWQQRASLRANQGWVRSVDFSPNGQLLAVGSGEGPIVLWDVKTRQAVAILKGHEAMVSSLAFSPNGEVLASGSMDGTVRLWNPTTRQERTILGRYSYWVRCLALSRDGKSLATGSEDATVRIWELATRQAPLIIRAHKLRINAVAFSPDSKLLATASTDNIVKLWDTTSWQERATIKGHTGISTLAFSPDGKRLATGGGADQTVKLWDVASPQPAFTTDSAFKGGTVEYSTNGKTILIGSSTGMKLLDATTRREIATLQIPQKGSVTTWVLLPDGKTVVTGDSDGIIKIWNIYTGQEIQTLMGHTDHIYTLALSRDGKILVSASNDRTAKVWDLKTWREVLTFRGHPGQVVAAALSADNKLVATGGNDKTVRLWELATGHEKLTFQGHRSIVTNVAFSPDGKLLASGSWDRTVKIWDVSTGRELATLRGHLDRGASLAFSPDGNTLATGSQDGMVRLWDVRTWQNLAILRGHTFWVGRMAFSPDGRTLVTGGSGADETVRFWEAASDQEVAGQLAD